MNLLETDCLYLSRQGRPLLEDITFTVAAGEIVVVLGPNGAGKSSLARILAGLIAPTSGRLKHKPKTRLGYVPQSINRDATLPVTAAHFLAQGSPRADATTKSQILAALQIEPNLHTSAAHLSGGEMRRIAIARALLREPDLLILDEPASGIDLPSQPIVHELIKSYTRQNKAGCILISHDIFSVLPVADRVLCLNREIVLAGPPGIVVQNPAFESLFGRPTARAAMELVDSAQEASDA